MDQIPRVLSFDRFELDLLRGCARVAGRDIELRPKAFRLLCHLAENAGRLVPKHELHDAVWGQVTVSDDALVQCIRELRGKLGDTDHTLIRTVPRRGYLLDVSKDLASRESAEAASAAAAPPEALAPPAWRRPWYAGWHTGSVVAVIIAALALGSVPTDKQVSPPPRDLVSATDARRLAQLAAEKELPLPAFHITSLAEDVPEAFRRFVGIWVSDTGWVYSDRQFMVIVTSVTRRGDVSGYFVNGPSKPHSRTQGPGFVMPFKGYVNAGVLRYDGYLGMYLANLNRDGEMDFKLVFQDGVIAKAGLKQIWTLPKSGRTESAEWPGGTSASARL